MASIMLKAWGAEGTWPIYMVDAAVGQGCPNHRDDVLLVQFFLHVYFGNHPEYMPRDALRPGQENIAIDGVCGPQTCQFIRAFQEERRAEGKTYVVDGRVDPVTTPFRDPQMGYHHTIGGLNVEHVRCRGVEVQRDIRLSPGFPQELEPTLYC